VTGHNTQLALCSSSTLKIWLTDWLVGWLIDWLIIHRESEKTKHHKESISSLNVYDRFWRLFHWYTQQEICNKVIITDTSSDILLPIFSYSSSYSVSEVIIFVSIQFSFTWKAFILVTPPPVRGTGYCFRAISFFVSLFLCLFLCQQHYEKTVGPICMKFSGKVWSDLGTTWFNFRSIRVNGSAGRRSICYHRP